MKLGDAFENGHSALHRAYYDAIQELADEVLKRVKESDEDENDVLHQVCDGTSMVIYTYEARLVCLISENSGYSAENFGVETVVKGGEIDWSAMAFGAVYADVMERIQ